MSFSYKASTEKSMKKFYDSLCEKDKRCYAAIESEKLPRGGVNYISELLDCDPKTIRRGQGELSELDTIGIRKPGGGRKKRSLPSENCGIDQCFLGILQEHTASDPMNSSIRMIAIGKLFRAYSLALSRFRKTISQMV